MSGVPAAIYLSGINFKVFTRLRGNYFAMNCGGGLAADICLPEAP